MSLADFQSPVLQSVHCPKGSDFTLSVRVGVHPGLRDYDQSFVHTPENPTLDFNFVAIDKALQVGLYSSLSYVFVTLKVLCYTI